MRVKILLNLGSEWPADEDGQAYKEDQEVDVAKELGEKMIRVGVAEQLPGGMKVEREQAQQRRAQANEVSPQEDKPSAVAKAKPSGGKK